MNSNSIASFLTTLIRTLLNTASDLWSLLSTPLFSLNLEGTLLSDLFSWITNGAFELGNYDVTLLWFLTSTAIILFIVLKLITLVNPVG